MPKLSQKTPPNQKQIQFPQDSFEPLPRRLKKNSFNYVLERREEDVAIYRQTMQSDKRIVTIAYEVFRVRKQKATDVTFLGNKVRLEPKELFPSNELFGVSAWSCKTLDRANQRFEELLRGHKNTELEN